MKMLLWVINFIKLYIILISDNEANPQIFEPHPQAHVHENQCRLTKTSHLIRCAVRGGRYKHVIHYIHFSANNYFTY